MPITHECKTDWLDCIETNGVLWLADGQEQVQVRFCPFCGYVAGSAKPKVYSVPVVLQFPEMVMGPRPELAKVQDNGDGFYLVVARWSTGGKWKIVIKLADFAQAKLYADQLQIDDRLRHKDISDAKDWYFQSDALRRKYQRSTSVEKKASEPRAPRRNIRAEMLALLMEE